MSRRGENIFKRKDGRWEGRYTSDHSGGKSKYSSVYAHSYAECAEKLRSAKNQLLPNRYPITLSELFGLWLQNRKARIKQSTYANYHGIFNTYIKDSLGNYRVDSISTQTLDRFMSILMDSGSKSGQPLSAKTVHGVMMVLKSVFDYGESVYGLKNIAKNICLPRYEVTETKVFSKSEIMEIRNAAMQGDSYELGILLCLYTGLRIGEICALKWQDIDLSEQIVHVRHTLTRIQNPDGDTPKTVVIIDTPKSKKSVRDIPLPPFLLSKLSEIKANQTDEDFFLTCNAKHTEPRTYSSRYKTFLKHIGVPYRNFHVLRHTFATECIKQGIDVKTVSELLGHTSVRITLERYVHSDMELKREQLKRLYDI